MDPLSDTTSPSTPVMTPWAKVMAGASFVFFVGWIIAFHLGAAYLSHAKYHSFGWAVFDFFFASFYYPFYALYLNTETPIPMMGGRRK